MVNSIQFPESGQDIRGNNNAALFITAWKVFAVFPPTLNREDIDLGPYSKDFTSMVYNSID